MEVRFELKASSPLLDNQYGTHIYMDLEHLPREGEWLCLDLNLLINQYAIDVQEGHYLFEVYRDFAARQEVGEITLRDLTIVPRDYHIKFSVTHITNHYRDWANTSRTNISNKTHQRYHKEAIVVMELRPLAIVKNKD